MWLSVFWRFTLFTIALLWICSSSAFLTQNAVAVRELPSGISLYYHNGRSSAPALPLQRRDPNSFMAHLGLGWAQSFQEFSSWLPARSAITTLSSFYEGMVHNAQHVWPLSDPSNRLLVSKGALTFELRCDKSVIPWTMVKDIANIFLEATELGFTGRYEGRFVYLGPAAAVTTIYVRLKVNRLMTV